METTEPSSASAGDFFTFILAQRTNAAPPNIRRQVSGNRLVDLNKGGFLVHRIKTKN